MSRGIRWVPAKSSSLGQAGMVASPVSVPGVSETVEDNGVMEKIIVGGLILAGATLLWTVAMGGSPQRD